MFWRKTFHILVISILLVGGIVSPSTAKPNKLILKSPLAKHLATSYTVCASSCDFSSIQTAIDTVSPGDTLELAAETFTESITIDKDLTIQGEGEESTIVQAATAPGIATSRVVTVTTEISVTIQGLTIRYGNLSEGLGGGIYNRGVLTLTNSIVINNNSEYGGGVAIGLDNRAYLSNVVFSNNFASIEGGGMFLNSGSEANLNNVIFSENEVVLRGGGLYVRDSNNIQLTNVTFTDNSATHTGPFGSTGNGGGMYSNNSDPILNNVIFSNNSATREGGGANLYGQSFSDGNPIFTNVSFSENSAPYGGGLWSHAGNINLSGVTFSGNTADYDGGGLYIYSGEPTLHDVTFLNNIATGDGGGIFYNEIFSPTLSSVAFFGNVAHNNGGGMYNHGTPIMKNVIFSGNTANNNGGGLFNVDRFPVSNALTISGNQAGNNGGGIYNQSVHSGCDPIGGGCVYYYLVNSIIWENSASVSGPQIYGGGILVMYSDIQGSGGSGAEWDTSLGADYGGNIDEYPFFVRDPNPGVDNSWGTSDDDYGDLHLSLGSPGIDAGDGILCPDNDFEGVSRPQGASCDMGVYEFHLIVEAGPNQSVSEGQLIQFSGDITNTATHSNTVHWNFGDETTATDILTPTHVYPDNGVFTITLTVTDTYDSTASDWLLATVENVAPTLSDLPNLEVTPGEIFTITATITDPGVLDTQTVVIAWMEGVTETRELGAVEHEFGFTYFYTLPGDYPVTVTVTDKDGGWGQKDFLVSVKLFETFLPLVLK